MVIQILKSENAKVQKWREMEDLIHLQYDMRMYYRPSNSRW